MDMIYGLPFKNWLRLGEPRQEAGPAPEPEAELGAEAAPVEKSERVRPDRQ
jgi:hypothetical protein